MKGSILAITVCGALALAGCGGGDSSSGSNAASEASAAEGKSAAASAVPGPQVVVPPGPPPKTLVMKDLKKGSGAVAKNGDKVTIEYVGTRYDESKPFTNSWENGKPFKFRLGSGPYVVSPAWETGIVGMRAGGRRQLIVPPRLLYKGGPVPGNTSADTVVFVIDLLAIN